jgi:hypothetical protein
MRSREAGDADQKAERPEPNRKDSGGTAKVRMRRVKLPRHAESISGSRRRKGF